MNNRKIGLEDLEEINKQNEQMKKNNKKIKKEKRSIFERFSTKENIIIFSFLLIFLIIGWNLIKNYDPYDVIDYRDTTIENMLLNSEKCYDRDTYWILNGILLNFLCSDSSGTIAANGESTESNLYYKFSTKEYYEALTDDYKIYLSEEQYLEKAKSVIKNYNENYENLNITSDKVPIMKVYKVNNLNGEYYIVRLNTKIDTYIGIQLIKSSSNFKIFYLE